MLAWSCYLLNVSLCVFAVLHSAFRRYQSSQRARAFSSGPAQLKSSLILFLPMTGLSGPSVWQHHCGAVCRPSWYVAALCGQVTAYLQPTQSTQHFVALWYYLKFWRKYTWANSALCLRWKPVLHWDRCAHRMYLAICVADFLGSNLGFPTWCSVNKISESYILYVWL